MPQKLPERGIVPCHEIFNRFSVSLEDYIQIYRKYEALIPETMRKIHSDEPSLGSTFVVLKKESGEYVAVYEVLPSDDLAAYLATKEFLARLLSTAYASGHKVMEVESLSELQNFDFAVDIYTLSPILPENFS